MDTVRELLTMMRGHGAYVESNNKTTANTRLTLINNRLKWLTPELLIEKGGLPGLKELDIITDPSAAGLLAVVRSEWTLSRHNISEEIRNSPYSAFQGES